MEETTMPHHPSSFKVALPRLGNADEAPWYPVGSATFVSVEHPCVVKSLPKALQTLGGTAKLAKLVSEKSASEEANLSFRPDGISRHIASGNVPTQGLLVRFTVPQRTGRRRRKGSQDPFEFPDDGTPVDQQTNGHVGPRPAGPSGPPAPPTGTAGLLAALRANPRVHAVHVPGVIEAAHRFRTLPDFVYSTRRSAFMARVRRQLAPRTAAAAAEFRLGPERGPLPAGADLLPPPWFSSVTLPFNYWYRQNPAARRAVDPATGAVSLARPNVPARSLIRRIGWDDAEVPLAPDPRLCAIADIPDPVVRRLAGAARALLEGERPIWSRRALANAVGGTRAEWTSYGKYVMQYVGYEWRSGPWRDLACRFGLDPRADPACRVYQSMNFQVDAEVRTRRAGPEGRKGGRRVTYLGDGAVARRDAGADSHLFDGASVSLDGKIWQVCDVTWPLVAELLATDNLRRECHRRMDGWYHNGTWAKARLLLRTRMHMVLQRPRRAGTAGIGSGPAPTPAPATGGGGERDLHVTPAVLQAARATDADLALVATLPDTLDARNRDAALLPSHIFAERAQAMAAAVRAMASTPEPRLEGGAAVGADADGDGDVEMRDGDGDGEGAVAEASAEAAAEAAEALDPRIQRAVREFTAMEELLNEDEEDDEDEEDEEEEDEPELDEAEAEDDGEHDAHLQNGDAAIEDRMGAVDLEDEAMDV